MKSRNIVIAVFLSLSFPIWAEAKEGSSFSEKLGEATRLGDTNEGKAYDKEFSKVVAPQLGDIVNQCTKGLGPRVKFDVVFVFAADGTVQEVATPDDQPAAKCVGDKLRNLASGRAAARRMACAVGDRHQSRQCVQST